MSVWITRFSLRLCAYLPLPVAHAIGAGAGRLAGWIPNRLHEYGFHNLRYCFPELSEDERKTLLRRSLMENGKGVMELGAFWHRERAQVLRSIRAVNGLEYLEQARSDGQGVIIAAPHLGAWELLGLYLSTQGELLTLYRPPRNPAFEQLLVSHRGSFGAHQVPAGRRGVRQLVKALKRHAMVGILPDQQPLSGQGVFAPFFGMPALTMTLLPRLAQHTGAPVVFAYAERLPRAEGFEVHFMSPWRVPPEWPAAQAAAELNRRVAQCVRALPAQYLWGYKRYSERPPGSPQAYPKNRKLARREARERSRAKIKGQS